jgi:hypothetical protein
VSSGVNTAEDVDGVGDSGWGWTDTTMVQVQTLVEVFQNTSLRSASVTDESFILAKSIVDYVQTAMHKWWIIKISVLS